MNKQKITIYTNQGMLGNISKIECKLTEIEFKDYAQYKNLLHVSYMMPRARKYGNELISTGYNPFLVVMNGWGHKDTQDPFKQVSDNGEVRVRKGLYRSGDSRWVTDFLETFDKNDKNIIAYHIYDNVFFNQYLIELT